MTRLCTLLEWVVVVFQPEIDGQRPQSLSFSRVLHVPALRNNLLSVLHLTGHHEFTVSINSQKMSFVQNGTLLFTASIHANAAYLCCTAGI
jgi:hypothetical protein